MSQYTLFKGTVKEVLSGDSLLVCTRSANGTPAERRIVMSGVNAPRLARREGDKEEAWAYQSREFLKSLVSGQPLLFKLAPNSAAVNYAIMYLNEKNPVDVIATCLAAGMVSLRNRERSYPEDIALEDAAKEAEQGIWAPKTSEATRNVKWAGTFKPKALFSELKGKTVKAEVSFVRSGHCLRVLLLDSWHQVTIFMVGIRAAFIEREKVAADPAALAIAEAEAEKKFMQLKDKAQIAGEDVSAVKRPKVYTRSEFKETCSTPAGFVARSFSEMRLAGRVVDITILDITPNGSMCGVVSIPGSKADIALSLVSRGLAKVDEYSVFRMPNAKAVRAAEQKAKDSQTGMWADYTAPEEGDVVTHEGIVTEVLSGDSFVLSNSDGNNRFFLASIRSPVLPRRDGTFKGEPGALVAKETLRKMLIGKTIVAKEQYSVTREERTRVFVTVDAKGGDVSHQLISLGLAKVVKGSKEGSRHPNFSVLLEAESLAQDAEVGVFAVGGAAANILPTDLTRREMVETAKTAGEGLSSRGAVDARVEFVSSGSRVKVTFAHKNISMNVMLAGVSAPRAPGRDGKGGEPLGDEARNFMRSRLNQRDVQVIVETCDKYGNLIAQIVSPNGVNMNVALLEVGLAKKSWNADHSPIAEALTAAVERAQDSRLGVWKDHDPEAIAAAAAAADAVAAAAAGPAGPCTVTITACNNPVNYHLQLRSEAVEASIGELNEKVASLDPSSLPALEGPFVYGQQVLALYEEDQVWYRAKVLKPSSNTPTVQFSDYGNKEVVASDNLRALPEELTSEKVAPHTFVAQLAFLGAPSDSMWRERAVQRVGELHETDMELKMVPVFTDEKGVRHVQLVDSNDVDVGLTLVEEGLALVSAGKVDTKNSAYVKSLRAAKDAARAEYAGQFRYGDVDEEE